MRLSVVAVLLALVAAACGGQTSSDTTAAPVTSVSTTAPGPAESSTAALTTSTVVQPGVVTSTSEPAQFDLFLVAVEASLADTSYGAIVVDEADVFLAIGQLMCERLDEGLDADTVLAEFLDALDLVGILDGDAPVAVGAVFGAAIELLCPHHANALGQP
jgi:hypothetical protein